MRLVFLDFEVTATARTEGAFGLGFDHGGGRNLDWVRPRRPGFELEQLLPRASERFREQAGAGIDRKVLRFEAGHGGTRARLRLPSLFKHARAHFKATSRTRPIRA